MSVFGRETPMERPNPGGRAAVFVPRADGEEAVVSALKNGSGMCGFGNPDGSLMIYFENNRFKDSSLDSWQNKVFKAYGRMVTGSPTTNKLSCDAANVIQIGFVEGGEILVRDMPALMEWLTRCGVPGSAPDGPEIHA
jgi:hypothetical protein